MSDHKPEPAAPPPGQPFAHFQWNYGWGLWEQVSEEAVGQDRVVAAYREPLSDASAFQDALVRLVAREIPGRRLDPEAMGEMIEVLARSVALTVALAAGGSAKRIDQMLTGVDNYIASEAATYAAIATGLEDGRDPSRAGTRGAARRREP